MMRAGLDAEVELARTMTTPPAMELKAVAGWIARLQSLCAEVRRAEKRALRTDVARSTKRSRDLKGEAHGAR